MRFVNLKENFTPSNFSKVLYNKGNVCFGGVNMKVIAKPIKVVSWTDTSGKINPSINQPLISHLVTKYNKNINQTISIRMAHTGG